MKSVAESLTAARNRYNRYFDEKLRTVPMLEAEPFVYVSTPLQPIISSEAEEAATTTYKKTSASSLRALQSCWRARQHPVHTTKQH